MTFFYDGYPRLALFLANPNHEGCLYVMASFALLACTAWLLRRHCAWRLVCGFCCGLGAAGAAVLLALTYSRGSCVAFLCVGLVASAEFFRRERCHSQSIGFRHSLRHFLFPAAFLLLVVLVIPGGGKRMMTMAYPAADLSIANRLCLWRGGTVVLAHNWLYGLGTTCRQPAAGYSLWLQPAEKQEIYRTFISDALTNSVCLGLPRYGILLTLCLWGCLALLYLWRRCGRAEFLWLLCAPVAFLVCGVFNTCTDEPLLIYLFLVLMATVWGIVLWDNFTHGQVHLLRHGLQAFCTSALFCVALCGAGFVSERIMPYRVTPATGDGSDRLSAVTLVPRRITASRRVLFFADGLEEHARTLLVPLASLGVPVRAFRCEGGLDCLDDLRAQLAANDSLRNTVVVAAGINAPNAVFAALGGLHGPSRDSCAIFFGLDMSHPMPELTPHLDRLASPPIIFTEEPGAVANVRFLPCDERFLRKTVLDTSGAGFKLP